MPVNATGNPGEASRWLPQSPKGESIDELTAASIAALNLADKDDLIIFDDAMPGFGYRLRRGASNKILRSWVCQYKRAGATRRITLGSAQVLGAEAARAAAKKLLAKVALGEDPQGARVDRRGKDLLTLRSQVTEYLAARESELRPRTLVEVRRYLTDPRYFGPLHRLPLDTITRRDISARLVAIARQSGTSTAARARGALSAFFAWCLRMGVCEANPTIGSVAPAASKGRDRVLSDDELARIWRACGDDDYGRIIKLLTLTSCRRAEIGNLAWKSEVDLERGTITISAARSKNHRAHTLPLTPMMSRILEDVPHMATRNQLFGVRGRGFTAWAEAKAKLDARSGVGDWTVHDLRRTVATRMADLGVQPHIVEQILNHPARPCWRLQPLALRPRGARRAGAVGGSPAHPGRGHRAQGVGLRTARSALMPRAALWYPQRRPPHRTAGKAGKWPTNKEGERRSSTLES
jgi:integrase